MTSRLKSFWKFVAEQVDDNPNPQSGGLEADRTKRGESGTIKIDPAHHAAIIQLGQAIIKSRRGEGTDPVRDAIKSLEAGGIRGEKLISLKATAERHLNTDPKMGGIYHKLAKAYQEAKPKGENLDTEA